LGNRFRAAAETRTGEQPVDVSVNIAVENMIWVPTPGKSNSVGCATLKQTAIYSSSQLIQLGLEYVDFPAEHMERAEINPNIFDRPTPNKLRGNRNPLRFLALDHHILEGIFARITGIQLETAPQCAIGPQKQISEFEKDKMNMTHLHI
jgi:hypothetical protein